MAARLDGPEREKKKPQLLGVTHKKHIVAKMNTVRRYYRPMKNVVFKLEKILGSRRWERAVIYLNITIYYCVVG